MISSYVGRDDIIDRVKFFKKVGREVELKGISSLRQQACNDHSLIKYSEVVDHSHAIHSLDDALCVLVESLAKINASNIVRIEFTETDSSISVVKVIIPKLESFDAVLKRVGPRLSKYVKINT